MEKGILHLHITVVIIFLLTFIFKTCLLLMNNLALLEKVRAKTKILEMVIGSLILLTGVYLLFITRNGQLYMIVKIILVLAAIPLGIIGLKKNSKIMAILSSVIFIYVYGVAETRSLYFNIGRTPSDPIKEMPDTSKDTGIEEGVETEILNLNEETSLDNAKSIYNSQCVQCHGPQGNLGVGGAKDLSISTLTDAEKEAIITNGKGLMAPFKYSLTEQEINQMVKYVNTFKK
jgi:uncharacterized membrane protein SirB2